MNDEPEVSGSARAVIDALRLAPHPEGGWFRETHRSMTMLPQSALPDGYPGDRCAMTCILFLLPTGAHSRWHRVRGDELWLHQGGDGLRLAYRAAMEDAPVHTVVLGAVEGGATGRSPGSMPQAVVPAGWWQAAQALPGENGYALVGCVVAPGFEFEDFELA